MISITRHKGFHMQFKNGWTASVQFGPGNYSGTHHDDEDYSAPEKARVWETTTAEVACWHRKGELTELDNHDTVKSYLTADEVLAFLNETAAREPA